ncbi:TonB-dependent siderophore receptor [Aliidiomarina minuta]|uniref:TonB-dependent siderophore receptor n=1 Tax=Aliidiomarina minuta TaxID=880057 RepID=UPI003B838C89
MSPVWVVVHIAIFSASAASAQTEEKNGEEAEENYERLHVVYHQPYRGNVATRDLPQAIDSLDRDFIADTNISRLQDLLSFSPSIALQNDGGSLWDSYSLRGFPGNENMPSGYLINGFDGGRGFSGHRDVSNIEYVEILKGPGSALYGRSDPGGIINITTRKPQYAPEGYLKLSAGSNDRYRLEGDYTRGISDDVAFRINGAWQDHGSFRDYVNSEKKVITPSVRWQLADNTALLYEFEYLQQSQLFDRGIVVLDNDTKTIPRERYLGEPADGPTEISARGHQLTLEHRLNNGWFTAGGISHRSSELSGYSSDAELAPARQQLFTDGRTLTRQRRYRDYHSEDTSLRWELSGSLNALGTTHNILLGADAYDYELYTMLARVRPEAGEYEIDIFEPVYRDQPEPVPVPLYANFETQQAWGVYVQNQFAISERWDGLLGLRLDDFEQSMEEQINGVFSEQRDQRLSPRAGLLFKANPELNLYASYSEGFLPLSGTDAAGNGFDPEESESFEMGFKWKRGDWALNGALFDATKTNILTSDPVNVGFPASLGAASSRGLELDLTTSLGADTELRLAYAFLDTKTSNEMVNLDWGITIPKGSPLINVPRHTANLYIKHYLQRFAIDGHLGTRVRYVDERLGDTVRPGYRLPAYTLVDVFYGQRLSDSWLLQVNVDNLFNAHYIANSYAAMWTTPGAPRQFSVSLRYDF